MSPSDIGTWIGTAVSIVGAVITIWQARAAVSAAQSAKQMRDEIEGKKTHGELSEVSGILTGALSAMSKYGPGQNPSSLIGSQPHIDAESVRTFTASLDLHSHILQQTLGTSCVPLRSKINKALDEFGMATTDEDRLKKGKIIYSAISEFSGSMKRVRDGFVFKTKP